VFDLKSHQSQAANHPDRRLDSNVTVAIISVLVPAFIIVFTCCFCFVRGLSYRGSSVGVVSSVGGSSGGLSSDGVSVGGSSGGSSEFGGYRIVILTSFHPDIHTERRATDNHDRIGKDGTASVHLSSRPCSRNRKRY